MLILLVFVSLAAIRPVVLAMLMELARRANEDLLKQPLVNVKPAIRIALAAKHQMSLCAQLAVMAYNP